MVSYKCHCPSLSTAKRTQHRQIFTMPCCFVSFVCSESDLRHCTIRTVGSRDVIDCTVVYSILRVRDFVRFKTIAILLWRVGSRCAATCSVTAYRDRFVISIALIVRGMLIFANNCFQEADRTSNNLRLDFSLCFLAVARFFHVILQVDLIVSKIYTLDGDKFVPCPVVFARREMKLDYRTIEILDFLLSFFSFFEGKKGAGGMTASQDGSTVQRVQRPRFHEVELVLKKGGWG